MPHRPQAAAIALLLAVTALAAACSASHPTDRVASLQAGQQTSANGTHTPTAADSDQAMLDYTTCMRAHGVRLRDPFHRPGHQGLSVELPTMTPPVRAANQACQHILQPSWTPSRRASASRRPPTSPR
jgi:hypothetical protein